MPRAFACKISDEVVALMESSALREKKVYQKYSDDREYKYVVYQSEKGTYEVWEKQR